MEIKKQEIGGIENLGLGLAYTTRKNTVVTELNRKKTLVKGKYLTNGNLSKVMTIEEFRSLNKSRYNDTIKKAVATVSLAAVIGSAVLPKDTEKQSNTKVSNIEVEEMQEAIMATASDLLFGELISPVMETETIDETDYVTYLTNVGESVYAPMEGVVKVVDDKLEISSNGYTVVLENVNTDLVNGWEVTLGKTLGVATGQVKMSIEDVNEKVVQNPGLVTINVTAEEKAEIVEQIVEAKVTNSIQTMDETIKDFLGAFGPELASSFEEYGVLPSTIAAQGILESQKGNSELAIKAKNLFGHKANKGWEGESYTKVTREVLDGVDQQIPEEFRVYETWGDAVEGHLEFLSKERYQKSIGVKDANQQIQEIANAGYATDPEYATKLQGVVAQYDLDKLNQIVLNASNTEFAEVAKVVASNKELVEKTKSTYEEMTTTTAEGKNPSVYITDATVDNADVKVKVDDVEVSLNKLDVANVSSEQAYEIIAQLKETGEYKITRNAMLEKLLQLLNNAEMNKFLTGNYENSLLDTLVELSDQIIGKVKSNETEKAQLESILSGKMAINANGKTYVLTNENKINTAIAKKELIDNISKDYGTLTFEEGDYDLEGLFVLLDAGHSTSVGKYSNDPGAASSINSKNEGQLNRDIALKLKETIERHNGKAVILQADGKHNYKAGERGAVANSMNPDVFISIHFNSIANEIKGANGSAVYYQPGQADGKALAAAIQKNQAKALHTLPNSGTVEKDLAVNRQSKMTSVLLEGAFISDPYQGMVVENEVAQQSMVNAYLAGIAEYFGKGEKENDQEEVKVEEAKVTEEATKVEETETKESTKVEETEATTETEPTEEVEAEEKTSETTDAQIEETNNSTNILEKMMEMFE